MRRSRAVLAAVMQVQVHVWNSGGETGELPTRLAARRGPGPAHLLLRFSHAPGGVIRLITEICRARRTVQAGAR